MLEECQREIKEAIADLRSLAHGIYPPLLMEEGLAKALSVAASRAPLRTTVRAAGLARYPEEVETAVYFCCIEALQNACQHAGPSAKVTIALHQDDDDLVFEVSDEGPGFDPDERTSGTGFVNMGDRLGTLGGSVRVDSAPGRGTTVRGTVPVQPSGDGGAEVSLPEATSPEAAMAPAPSADTGS